MPPFAFAEPTRPTPHGWSRCWALALDFPSRPPGCGSPRESQVVRIPTTEHGELVVESIAVPCLEHAGQDEGRRWLGSVDWRRGRWRVEEFEGFEDRCIKMRLRPGLACARAKTQGCIDSRHISMQPHGKEMGKGKCASRDPYGRDSTWRGDCG